MPGNRRSRRWRGFWYGAARLYYVTLVLQDRKCLLGRVEDDRVVLSPAGLLVHATWSELKRRFPGVRLDAFVVMPNHVHGIVGFRRPAASGSAAFGRTLGELMAWFKTQTTRRYTHGVRHEGWPRFPGRFWQRNYYDHVIRDEHELNHGRRYIWDNPRKWARDRENPNRVPPEREGPDT